MFVCLLKSNESCYATECKKSKLYTLKITKNHL
nr:MAG TPA: hypothetical protein [Caudoviricetes sp.]